ncbi:MAG: hypothetical protein SOX14_08260 [Ruminococcus callidus]|nr:hypothetical protein [Ruminococcus callidus]
MIYYKGNIDIVVFVFACSRSKKRSFFEKIFTVSDKNKKITLSDSATADEN